MDCWVQIGGRVVAKCEFTDDAILIAARYGREEKFKGDVKAFWEGPFSPNPEQIYPDGSKVEDSAGEVTP